MRGVDAAGRAVAAVIWLYVAAICVAFVVGFLMAVVG